MFRMIQGLIRGRGKGVFPSAKHPEHRSSQPSLLLNLVAGVLSPWAGNPGCEADHSLPSGVEVKEQWSYTFNPPISVYCMSGTNLRLHGVQYLRLYLCMHLH